MVCCSGRGQLQCGLRRGGHSSSRLLCVGCSVLAIGDAVRQRQTFLMRRGAATLGYAPARARTGLATSAYGGAPMITVARDRVSSFSGPEPSLESERADREPFEGCFMRSRPAPFIAGHLWACSRLCEWSKPVGRIPVMCCRTIHGSTSRKRRPSPPWRASPEVARRPDDPPGRCRARPLSIITGVMISCVVASP